MKLSTGLVIEAIPDLSGITEVQKQHCRNWIAALRSNNYRQCFGRLKEVCGNGDSYCCMGVACDVASKDGLGSWQLKSHTCQSFQVGKETPTIDWYWLPEAIRKYYGLPVRGGLEVHCQTSNIDGLDFDLMELNDKLGVPFVDIALILETALNGGLKETPSTTKEAV